MSRWLCHAKYERGESLALLIWLLFSFCVTEKVYSGTTIYLHVSSAGIACIPCSMNENSVSPTFNLVGLSDAKKLDYVKIHLYVAPVM